MIKTTSWHYKLANFGDCRVRPGLSLNFCEYSRAVFIGMILLFFSLIVAAGILAIAGIVLLSFYQVFMGIFYGIPFTDVAASIAFSATLLVALPGGCVLGAKYFQARQKAAHEAFIRDLDKPKKSREPGFFQMLYSKFKDRTCFIVKVEE